MGRGERTERLHTVGILHLVAQWLAGSAGYPLAYSTETVQGIRGKLRLSSKHQTPARATCSTMRQTDLPSPGPSMAQHPAKSRAGQR